MHRRYISVVIFFSVFIYTCKTNEEKSDIAAVGKSYGLIYTAFAISNIVQNDFFGEATELLDQLRKNNDVEIDTKKLELLLDSSKIANESQMNIINLADEPDPVIGYKGKALKFVKIVKELYDNQFPQLISILNSKTENKFEKSQALLMSKMNEMSKAMHECHDAGQELR